MLEPNYPVSIPFTHQEMSIRRFLRWARRNEIDLALSGDRCADDALLEVALALYFKEPASLI